MSVVKLSPSKAYEFIVRALKEHQVPYISGPSAIGKSQVVHKIAKDANAKIIDLRLSQMLSEDLTGLPERDSDRGKAVYLPFDTIPLENDSIPNGYSGWLLFTDELSSAQEEVLAAAYSIYLDRMVGGKKIHPKCLIVAAGNRSFDSAIARELPDTLLTRMLPFEMIVNHRDWINWANENNINEAIINFIEKEPSQLYAFVDAASRSELEIFATPRGWEKASAHLTAHENSVKQVAKVDKAGVPIPLKEGEKIMEPVDDITFSLMAASVGRIAAQAFRDDYDEAIQLPYPWEVAQSPNSTRIPNTGVGKIQLSKDLAKFFLESDTQSRDAVLCYMNRMGGEHGAYFYKVIKDNIGTTNSDLNLLQNLEKRLKIEHAPDLEEDAADAPF